MPSLPLVETAAPEKPQPKPVLPVDHRDEFRLVTKESGVPFLENVPYINRLFKNVGVYRAREMNNSELNNGHPLQTPYEMRRQKQLQSPSNVYRLIKNVGAHQPRQIDNYELLWWDVSKVLGELRKQELGSQTAEERLMSMLPCHYPGENGESSTPNGKSAT